MQTPDTTTATASSGETATKECSTRGLIEKLEAEVKEAQLAKELADRQATALAEHLEQLKGYDTKIGTAYEAYRKDIGTVDADYDSLRGAVDQSEALFECLVSEETRKKIADIRETLHQRRETLRACVWTLNEQILDQQCTLEHMKAKVASESDDLEAELARLELCKGELADLKDLKESIDCPDGISNSCRYGYYLDLVERLKVKCPSAHDYMCDLVKQVENLDKARQDVTASEDELSVARARLARVTQSRDELEDKNWRKALCQAITDGSVPALPKDIDKACAPKRAPGGDVTPPATVATGTTSQHAQTEPEQRPDSEPAQPAPGS